MLGRDQGGTIKSTEVRPDVDENQVGFEFIDCQRYDAPQPAEYTESTGFSVQTVWPLAR